MRHVDTVHAVWWAGAERHAAINGTQARLIASDQVLLISDEDSLIVCRAEKHTQVTVCIRCWLLFTCCVPHASSLLAVAYMLCPTCQCADQMNFPSCTDEYPGQDRW